ncbi:MAG: cytochrome c biogenesis protein CcsA [Saprospiraceae bacterium]
MKQLKAHWWKFLGVAILVIVFLKGMLVPLSAGIISVSRNSAKPLENLQLVVKGYNTHFKDSKGPQAWLKLDSLYSIQCSSFIVADQTTATVAFWIPAGLPYEGTRAPLTLIIDNEVDGTSVLPFAVSFVVNDIASTGQGWNVEALEGLHERTHTTYPFRNILNETIRNTYFHVPLWFGMMVLFIASVISAIKYIRSKDPHDDLKSLAFCRAGILFGILGLVTGAIWAKHTWGAYWSWDVKQNMSAIALLIYGAYFVLRNSMSDNDSQARIAAVYNIFAFVTLIPLLFVIPRLTDSLHPGNGGNPALGGEDLDHSMRMVFYPAIIGWTLLGVWIAQLSYRVDRLKHKLLNH